MSSQIDFFWRLPTHGCSSSVRNPDLSRGDWRPWISLWAGALVCGFFWELWNFWSYPKWIYHVPYVGVAKVFEMPLLGYLGYFPFAMELWLLAHLLLPRGPQVEL